MPVSLMCIPSKCPILAGVAGQFAFLPLGEEASVQCVLPDDATDVEWYEGENLILGASEDNVTALDVTVLDTLHLALYTCQGRDQDRSYYFYTKIIVQGWWTRRTNSLV